MSEELVWCVRGCTERCRSEACAVVGEHDHEPIRRRADVGLLCLRCSDRIIDALDDIELMYPDLDLYAVGAADPFGDGLSHGKTTGSPALVRLDVMVLQDVDAAVGDGVRSVIGTLGSWVRCVEEELGPKPKNWQLSGILDLLRTWHDNICYQPWVDDYYDEVIEVRGMLKRATNAPPPIARCWGHDPAKGCGRWLYPPREGDRVVCRRCGRTYAGADLVKLQIQGERDSA